MIFSLLRFSALIILFQQIISPRCKRSCLRLVKKLTGEFMRVSELHFLIEYKILKGFVCWCRERAQLKYEARSCNWIWLDKFMRCYVRIKFGPKCNKVLNVRTFGPKCNKPPMESFICVRALSFIADIHTEMLKWQRLHQRILWPIFMAYCGLADVNQRLFVFQRSRSRSTGYKPLYWCAFGIKLTEVKVMKMMTTTSLFLYHSLRLHHNSFHL